MPHVQTTRRQGNGRDSIARQPAGLHLTAGTLGQLEVSLKRKWKRYRRSLKRCQQKFSEKAVHQSRVETRRLLANLELLGSFLAPGRLKKAQIALKRHLDTFDDLRDTHVQLITVQAMADRFPAAAKFEAYLKRREERFTRQTRKCVNCIKSRRLNRLICDCRDDVKKHRKKSHPEKINTLLLNTVESAFARTLRLKKQIDPERTETIHRTRVAFKKFRYMVETLAQCLPRANEKLFAAMHGYQTLMGEIQDAEVVLRGFDKFSQKKKVEPKPGRIVREELLRRRRRL